MLTSDQTSSIMAPSTRKNVNESSGSESPMKRRKTNRQTVEDYIAMPVESQQNNPRSIRGGRKANVSSSQQASKSSNLSQKAVLRQMKMVAPQRSIGNSTSYSTRGSNTVVNDNDDSEFTEESGTEDERTEKMGSEITDEASNNTDQRGKGRQEASKPSKDHVQTRKDRVPVSKGTRMSKNTISADMAVRDNTDDDETHDTRSDFKKSSLREIMKLKNITKLVSKVKDYLRMVQEENPDSFASGQKLILSLPPAWSWAIRSEYDLNDDKIEVDTKDQIWQIIFRRGLRSQKQKRLGELVVEWGLSDETLEKEVQKHSGPDGMTKNTGASILINDYEVLMRMYLKICTLRFGEAFKNAWRAATYDNVLLKDQCRFIDQNDVDKGTVYGPDWIWLQKCIVKNSRVMKPEEYNQGGTSISQINKYVDVQLRTMMKPQTITSFYENAIEATFNAARGTDQYELPQFLKDEIESTVRDKKAEELLAELRSSEATQDDMTSIEDQDNSLSSTILAKDLLDKHVQNKRNRAALTSEIDTAIEARRQQEINDWNDHGEKQVLEGILQYLVKVENNMKARQRPKLSS